MIYKLLPPNDERVLSSIVPFDMEGFVAIIDVTLTSIYEFGKQK